MNKDGLKRQIVVSMAFLATAFAQPAPLNMDGLLNESPFVMTHNAATGYLVDLGPLENPLTGYSKNQNGTFTDQLNCGARALDLEPAELENDIFFRHLSTPITEISFQDGLKEILDWAVGKGELILLKIVRCTDGQQCNERVQSILNSAGVEFLSNCGELASLTVAQALNRGPVLAIAATCFDDNYDPTLTCHGFGQNNPPSNIQAVRDCIPADFDLGNLQGSNAISQVLGTFDCLKTSLDPAILDLFDCWKDEFPFTMLFNYLEETVSEGPPQNGRLWQWQALWQTNEDSILLGVFRPLPLPLIILQVDPSGILKDLKNSELNRRVLEYTKQVVQSGRLLNLVEVDDVCDPFASQLLNVVRQQQVNPAVIQTSSPSAVPKAPSASPSATPITAEPTESPTVSPMPTSTPTVSPSLSPVPSGYPSVSPAPTRSMAPSLSPSTSSQPSSSPRPSAQPSGSPSEPFPSSLPTGTPTSSPSEAAVTDSPTEVASASPSASPVTPAPTPQMPVPATSAPSFASTTANPQTLFPTFHTSAGISFGGVIFPVVFATVGVLMTSFQS